MKYLLALALSTTSAMAALKTDQALTISFQAGFIKSWSVTETATGKTRLLVPMNSQVAETFSTLERDKEHSCETTYYQAGMEMDRNYLVYRIDC